MDTAQAATKYIAIFWRSLPLRLTVATLVVLLIGIWGLMSYGASVLRQDMERMLIEQQQAVAAGVAQSVDRALRERILALEVLVPLLQPSLLAGASALQTELQNKPAYRVIFNQGLFVMSADGTMIADNPVAPGRVGRNYMNDPDVAHALRQGKVTVSRPSMGPVLKTPVFFIVVPILDAQGRVLGAVGGLTALGQPSFLDQVSEARYGRTGGFLLVSRQQRLIITATDKSRIMTTLPAAGVIPAMDTLLANQAGGSAVWTNPLGVEVLTSARLVPTAGWMVAVALPTAEAFEPIQHIRQRVGWAAVAMSLLASGLVWLVLRNQLAPLREASANLRARSSANLPYQPLPVHRPDEIGDLIGGFNLLLANLQQREQDLQQASTALQLASELQLRTGEMAQVGGWQVDLQTQKLTWTPETFRIAERLEPVEPALDEGINLFAPEARPVISAAVQAAMEQGTPYDLELPIITEQGANKWVRTQGFALYESDKLTRIHGTFQDITQRKNSSQVLEHALAEKTALLNEVHHRVKNNLQVITSLLRLESGRSTHDDTKAVLADMSGRIRAMALLHESLYRTGIFASVELGAYLKQLCQHAYRSIAGQASVVRLELDLAKVSVTMDQATPCGLLVNELISNSFKHGFPDGRAGQVRVSLQVLPSEHCRVQVADDGVGLPADLAQKRIGSLGLQLVSDLVRQLGGTLEIGTGPGAVFTLVFPIDIKAAS